MDKKWNLQDIRPAGEKRKRRAAPRPVEEPPAEEPVPSRSEPRHARRSGGGNRRPLIIGFAVLLAILGLVFVIGYLMDGSEITVHPRVREPNVNATLEAFREQQAGELSYEVMTLEAEGERQVTATGEEEVEEQATGVIEIRNTRSTSERLIKNTRFESAGGLIFRITESVVVPAASDGTPGTAQAEVFADEPGEEYNIGPSEFTIPGYAEGGYDDLFESVTARSTTAMTGGFSGLKYIVDDDELAAAKESLHSELEEALRSRVEGERPAGFVMFDNAVTFSYESLPSEEAGENQVVVREKVLLHVPLFESAAFASYLAGATIPGYENEPVRIDNPETLSFAYAATSTENMDLRTVESFSFDLSGTPLIVWTFDEEQLKEDLAGAAKTALRPVLGAYPAIERATAVIRPFWKRSFPADTESIEITEAIDTDPEE